MTTFTPKEVIKERKWVITWKCLANWRTQGRGPKFEKKGWAVLYTLTALQAFERENPWVLGTPDEETL